MGIRAVVGFAVAFSPYLLQAAEPPATAGKRAVTVEDLIEVKKPAEVAISPDGKWVSYVLTTPVLKQNHYVHDIYVVPSDGSAAPRQITHSEPRTGFLPSFPNLASVWAPTSDRLVFVAYKDGKTELRGVDIKTGKEEVLVAPEVLAGEFDFKPDFQGDSIAYSPDGNSLAFIANKPPKPVEAKPPMRGMEVGEDWMPQMGDEEAGIDPVGQLFILDLKTRKVRTITDASLHIAAFRWSPDSKRLALEAVADPAFVARYIKGDIYVVDAAGGKPRALVSVDGWDRQPVWSPDGKDIAFCTQRGKTDWMYTCSLAIVSADGSKPPRDIGRELDKLNGSSLASMQWTSDARSIDVSTRHRLSRHLFRVSVADGKVSRITTRDDRTYDEIAYSGDGKLMAFREQGAATPPDVYVTGTDSFKPRRLTHLNPAWDNLTVPSTQIVKWRSKDDRWDVHGLLLKPSNYSDKQKYPMLTAIIGGPSMIEQDLNPIWNYPLLALAEQGYVIFMPNSRGRGGFGADFNWAIRDERSYVLNPLSDNLTGVDEMVKRGIADPDKLGVLGFSYGGTQTAYAITVTDRFKAAIYGEGSPLIIDWFKYRSTAMLGLLNDMWGFGNPFEPKEIRSGFEQSSIFRLDKVHTPVLVEAGEKSAWETDRSYFRGLRHFKVPSEFYVYPRSGHGWDEPLLMQDAYRRHIVWFDYWIKGKPYSDAKKQQAYDAWKKQRTTQLGGNERERENRYSLKK